MKNSKKGTISVIAVTLVVATTVMISGQAMTSEYSADKVMHSIGVASVLESTLETNEELVERWGYQNLGLANVENHLNIRAEASESGKLVGKMSKDAACEIISFDGEWAQIKSGEVEGYVSTSFLLMGEQATYRANEIIKLTATVKTDALEVRKELNTEWQLLRIASKEGKL